MESTVNTLANVFERIDALPDNLCQIMEMEGVVRDLFRRVHGKMQDAERPRKRKEPPSRRFD